LPWRNGVEKEDPHKKQESNKEEAQK